jgi:hypothetical protein
MLVVLIFYGFVGSMLEWYEFTGRQIKRIRMTHDMHIDVGYRKRHAIFYGGNIITGNMAAVNYHHTARADGF